MQRFGFLPAAAELEYMAPISERWGAGGGLGRFPPLAAAAAAAPNFLKKEQLEMDRGL